jgi:hypothetical protein
MNASFNIESILIGVTVAAIPLAVMIVMQRRAAISSNKALREKVESLEQRLTATVATHNVALEEARREMSIVAYPYERTEGDDGWLVDDRLAEIGYQYQLFIKGIPCFSPHEVITKRVHKKEVNQEKLTALRNDVETLLTTVANQHPAFSFSKKVLGSSK